MWKFAKCSYYSGQDCSSHDDSSPLQFISNATQAEVALKKYYIDSY